MKIEGSGAAAQGSAFITTTQVPALPHILEGSQVQKKKHMTY